MKKRGFLVKLSLVAAVIALLAGSSAVFAEKIPCKECKERFTLNKTDIKSRYNDLDNNYWANRYINYCVDKNMISGYPDGSFRPNEYVGTQEFVKMVTAYKFGNLPAQNGEKWYMPYVKKAVSEKILVDTEKEQKRIIAMLKSSDFNGNSKKSKLSKSDAAMIITNLLEIDKDTEVLNNIDLRAADKIAAEFANSEAILNKKDYQRVELMKIVACGIISGNDKKELNTGEFTRAECAAILAKYANIEYRKTFVKNI